MSAPTQATAVSSSSTLWATPSKEWVIPAKPKPGRKPKKEIAVPMEEDVEVDTKGRRVQNRAAQRAFRERKQSQLAELQARVQQYEQGEIERNVALQTIAKRLKEENEKIRKENTLLKEKLAKVEEERDALREATTKRWREASPNLYDYPRKRVRVASDALHSMTPAPSMPVSYTSSPSSMASSPDSGSHTSFSPMPVLPPPREMPVFFQGNALSNIFDFISNGKTSLFEPGASLDTFNCGFCNENTPCVCRELALQQISERMSVPNITSSLKMEGEHKNTAIQLDSPAHLDMLPAPSRPSILDNLPAYQPPVPLRRRAGNTTVNSIFPVSLPSPSPARPAVATCSGDPSNCLACADDPFGKAFCAAISETVASTSPCGNCPARSDATGCQGVNGSCCGNPAGCGRSAQTQPTAASLTPAMSISGPSNGTDMMPCDDAWRQIKSHPNVAFADLSLLAEVVARRSKCTGPRVEISPAPGSITPERGISPSLLPQSRHSDAGQPILLTDPHAQYHERQRDRIGATLSPSPRLSPQEVLMRCGRRRVREVQADGVRDALRLLDSKFALP